MLRSLHISNYAIINEARIGFGEGMHIITGETGAGKSILLGALGLILGERADSRVLYQKDKKCVVEGTFSIADYGLKSFFTDNNLDYEEETIIIIAKTVCKFTIVEKLINYVIISAFKGVE